MSVRLRAVGEAEKGQLRGMLSTYLQELSQYGAVDADYVYFDSYWTDQDRWPYFIDHGGVLAGFSLINTWSTSLKGTDFAVAEFYIKPEFRSAGVGKGAFTSLLERHPGIWELSVLKDNHAAEKFWRQTIATADVKAIERIELDDVWIYRFMTAEQT